MGFTRDVVRDRLKASLLDAVSIFGEDDPAIAAALDRHLDGAVADFDRVIQRKVSDRFNLVAGVAHYTAPDDAMDFHSTELVSKQMLLAPWDPQRVPLVPTPMLTEFCNKKAWKFEPVPTQDLLSKLGCLYPYTYFAAHALDADADKTTIPIQKLPLLVLRAQVESMRELAMRNAHKPFQTRDGLYSQTRNGTPAALAELFLGMFEQQCRPSSDGWATIRMGGGHK